MVQVLHPHYGQGEVLMGLLSAYILGGLANVNTKTLFCLSSLNRPSVNIHIQLWKCVTEIFI